MKRITIADAVREARERIVARSVGSVDGARGGSCSGSGVGA